MSYQVLALDLDGTTLRDDHTLNPWVIECVQQLAKKYHVMVVTGRHHTAAKPYYEELGIDTPIICCNGVYRYDYASDTVETSMPIPKSLAKDFLSLANQHALRMVMYTESGMAYLQQNPMPYMIPLQRWAMSYPIEKRPNIYQIEDFRHELELATDVWKFVVQGDDDNFHTFMQEPAIVEHFSGSFSGENRVDLAMKGHSKGQALKDYLATLQLDIEQAVAVGDNYNDVSMLSMAGCGVAMLHADEGVKRHADRVTTTDNHGEGLAQLLKQLFPL
ncbi:Cof-type HAD-IIB family hydrolase [Vibrio parahaemolyticus]|uniref:Cof-type HAD-IIB family hydrolase n=1 Tax=Vibrio parahaemolyticus TaxID=670 RepID=UPI0003F883A5|nr:Cof-type HAD-IIB family hydrolase [Vibrio parahaemolyticus]HCE4763470.1 Cof-type HAD-IIB family hydrolase [Vibrio parahaemolyticus]HCG8342694.1 Cof-type HAD-IIB family hydrolase [Vibrio parahaemolyticus]HCG8347502.1 Cof-type HAD-IIB family hydrolase [Vibrio parahaemolyticus]HCH1651246.1 Cof-type HAD-IIB family hydrolase [Vibrio parahaemolyticus]HCH3200318.1 Cof-type HAD-IIB family hydrolase [Vibrio parahaemolyticus]